MNRTLPALLTLLALSGCASPAYYFQAINGQLEILRNAQPIERVIADPQRPAPLRQKLATALRIREFASRELALPDNGSYRRFTELDRPFVVWNVFAAEEFSVRPKQWCFPVVGCVGYRGYFSREQAEDYAAELRRRGFDVFVGGVPAYSTLGWFDDPVLSTFIHYPESEVARLIFHELAHQLLYVNDDSEFNESFASTVDQVGVERWLTAHGTERDRAAFALAQSRKAEYLALVKRYRGRLEALYAAPLNEAEKREQKATTLAEFTQDFQALKASWGAVRFDPLQGQAPSNAYFASVAIYTRFVPAFQAMLAREGGDLRKFYQAARKVAKLPRSERDAYLAELGRLAAR